MQMHSSCIASMLEQHAAPTSTVTTTTRWCISMFSSLHALHAAQAQLLGHSRYPILSPCLAQPSILRRLLNCTVWKGRACAAGPAVHVVGGGRTQGSEHQCLCCCPLGGTECLAVHAVPICSPAWARQSNIWVRCTPATTRTRTLEAHRAPTFQTLRIWAQHSTAHHGTKQHSTLQREHRQQVHRCITSFLTCLLHRLAARTRVRKHGAAAAAAEVMGQLLIYNSHSNTLSSASHCAARHSLIGSQHMPPGPGGPLRPPLPGSTSG